ncbi:MAG: DUF1835 domain-containing protein [Planctomycetota bacterium]|nr:DUF1835 domain-containing protein [Planctomycetota bacterium]MDP7133266.1 DUF1835 domain-containing protein [Planctomycetota bacterium]MDP7254721.1 DUF1835 domain-containing protein [Planctomycetota bacterium]
MLHITNGDSVTGTMKAANLPGTYLPWRDVLHDGPVPAGKSLNEMSEVRAQFVQSLGWESPDALEDFRRRDRALEQSHLEDEIILWFEHDLYDQLQLIQLLDWFARHGTGSASLSLICIGDFPGIEKFLGLGQLAPNQLLSLWGTQQAVTRDQLHLGRRAWEAFTSPDPMTIQEFLKEDTSALPFLDGALTRHLEQFPSVKNGLSRTEQQILEALAPGFSQRPVDLFGHDTDMEQRVFFGDLSFFMHLNRLARGVSPPIEMEFGHSDQGDSGRADYLKQSVFITDQGRSVLSGKVDNVAINGIDRWIGGAHLTGDKPLWRWDTDSKVLVRDEEA